MAKEELKTEEQIVTTAAGAQPLRAAEDPVKPAGGDAAPDTGAEISQLTDKWKRALADAENARKCASAARLEGREHGIAVAVEALAPALDALSLGIEAAHKDPEAGDPRSVAHLEGLRNIRTAFETGLKALGVTTIAAEDVAFDPNQNEAIGTLESGNTNPGRVLSLHRPGFAIGQRLIRPARVTVSASPSGRGSGGKEED
ncbi:nucleotide exchange factor GrpE [Cribrihabitans pelagius]|uniref:nucleotide exchange factor GrpE n=1 Tax=Cribrihabitans pelagius TaxID=1765746 RepID=UPI003B59CC8B